MKLKFFLFVLLAGIVLFFSACELDGVVTVRITGFQNGVDDITFGTSEAVILISDTNGSSLNGALGETVTINGSSISVSTSTVTGGTTVFAAVSIATDTGVVSVSLSEVQNSATVVAGDVTISYAYPGDFQ